MNRYLYPLVTGLILGCSQVSFGAESVNQELNSSIKRLMVAKMAGDIPVMSDAYQKARAYVPSCDEAVLEEQEKKDICSFDCYLQLADYHLYMAGDIEYYFSKAALKQDQVDHIKPEAMAEHAQEGLCLADRALTQLGSSSKDHSGGEGADDFRDFLIKKARLSIVKAKLLLSSGDIWYQSASFARIDRLYQIYVSDPWNHQADKSTDKLAEARTYYEQAMWELADASMDTPKESLFNEITNELRFTKHELDRRLKSIRNGHLFLDIDPEAFTTLDQESIESRLVELKIRVKEAEEGINSMIEKWVNQKNSEGILNAENQGRSLDISLSESSFKIAKLEAIREQFVNQMNTDLLKKETEIQSFEELSRFNATMAEVGYTIEGLNIEKDLIEKRKDIEILNYKQGSWERKLSDLRWLIDFNVLTTNLELQLSTFSSELLEYNRQIKRNVDEVSQIDMEKRKVEFRVQIERDRISEARSQIQLIQKTQNERFELVKDSYKSQLCALESRIAFLDGSSPANAMCDSGGASSLDIKSYKKNICEARKLLEEQNLTSLEEMKNFLEAESKQTIEQIYEAEAQLIEAENTILTENKTKLLSLLNTVSTNLQKNIGARLPLAEFVGAAQGAHLAAAAIPVIEIGLAGGTEIDASRVTEAILQGAQFLYEAGASDAELRTRYEERIEEIQGDIARVTAELKKPDFDKKVKEALKNRAISEIAFQIEDYNRLIQQGKVLQPIMKLECDQDGAEIEGRVAEANYEHQSVFNQLQVESKSNDLLSYQIASHQTQIQLAELEIETLMVETQQLERKISDLESDNSKVDELKKLVEQRKTSVKLLQSSIAKSKGEVDELTAQIASVAELVQNKVISLSDDEVELVNNNIRGQNQIAENAKSRLETLKRLNNDKNGIYDQLSTFHQNLDQKILSETDKISSTVAKMKNIVQDQQEVKLLHLSQEELAQILPGVPDFIRSKKTVLESANRYLALLRSRVSTTMNLAGADSENLRSNLAYIRNSEDLDLALDLFKDSVLTENLVTVETRTRVIPRYSGLARALASDRSVRFELSPMARTQSKMEDLGYFVMWEDNLDADNVRLVDLLLRIRFGETSCESKLARLSHLGSGYVFSRLSENDDQSAASFVEVGVRSKELAFAVAGSDSDYFNDIGKYWSLNAATPINRFLKEGTLNPPNDNSGSMPLLGVPAIGIYEINLPKPPRKIGFSDICSYDDADFELFYVFSKQSNY